MSAVSADQEGEAEMIRKAGLIALAIIAILFLFFPLVACGQEDRQRVLIIVTRDFCPPCDVFDRVYTIDRELREALHRAFDVRELDLDIPSQRLAAERLGVKAAPAFLVLRDEKPVSTHFGFSPTMEVQSVNRAIADLMDDLGVEWPVPRAEPPRKSEPAPRRPAPEPQPEIPWKPLPLPEKAGPVVDQVAREQIGQLDRKVESVRSEVSQSASKLQSKIEQESRESRSQFESISKSIKESISLIDREKIIERERPAEPAKPEPIEQAEATEPTSSKWLKVLGWAAKTGLTIAAPEIALPGAAGLAVLGLGWQWMKGRRQARRQRPVDATAAEIPPAVVRVDQERRQSENHYIVKESDTVGEAYKEACRRVAAARKSDQPGIVDVIKQIDHVAGEIVRGRKIVDRPNNAPRSGIWSDPDQIHLQGT